jgi:hypothetical protein
VPSTVHIHVESEARFLSESPDFLELCRLPLEAGQNISSKRAASRVWMPA